MGNTATSRALAPTDSRSIKVTGSFNDAEEVTNVLQYAAKNYHLVSPATACGAVPEGCSIAMSTVLVDVENETYDVGGKRGLAKSALDKIAAAAGISWDARISGRLDDGSDPHYVMWRAVGQMRHLDGTLVQIVGTKEMDLRQGSAQVEALWERYESKLAKWKESRRGYEPKPPTGQIREMRLHIVAHAESKARLRAIRSLGVRAAYADAELKKPFVIAKIMWTGQTKDPELRRAFAMKQADAMLGGHKSLYGDLPPAPLPSVAGMPQLAARRPPPIGTSADPGEGEAIDVPAQPPSEPKSAREPAPTRTERSSEPPRPPSDGPVARFGKQKDVPLAEIDDDDLDWYANAVKKSVDDPQKARFKADNEAHYRDVCAERDRRNGVPDDEASESAADTDRGEDPDAY